MYVDKNRPSEAWIRSLRSRYLVEPEIDRVLTRKLQRRPGPGYSPVALSVLVAGVESLLRAELSTPFSVTDARWLSGGASKLQMAFTLDWDRPGSGRESRKLVLRMEPAESLVETSRRREFQLLRAAEAVVPVPHALWCDPDAKHLPYPSLIYTFSDGVSKPADATSGVSGAGMRMSPQWRESLAPQFLKHLASIHNLDYASADLSAFRSPSSGREAAELGMNWWDRVWEEDCDEDVPMLRVASAWLRDHLPESSQCSIVHGDYRTGNFLFTESDGRISAILDWELGRIGDRHQDLAWATSPAFTSLADDNKTILLCGLLPESAFFEGYEAASGFRIDRKTLHWYKVYNNFWLTILYLGTGYRIALNGKSHQDVLVTWLSGLGYLTLTELRDLLEKGA